VHRRDWLRTAAGAALAGRIAPAQTSDLRERIEQFTADRGNLSRFYSVEISPARAARMNAFHSGWLSDLAKIDFDRLSFDGQVDYVLFRNHLERALEQAALLDRQVAETGPILPFARRVIELQEARQRMEPVDAQKAAAALSDLPKQIAATMKEVEKAKPAKAVAIRASQHTQILRDALKNWYVFYNEYDPRFTWWMADPYKKAEQSLKDYQAFLLDKVAGIKPGDPSAITGDPIGRDALIGELRREMIPYSPEQLFEIGKRQLDWCQQEMRKAAGELGFGDDWRKALEHVKNLFVEPGDQPKMIRDLAFEAIEYVEKNELVTVPPLAKETFRMDMMTPERQLVAPFFLGGERILVSYPTSTMTHEQKLMSMRGNNPYFSRATVHHELIPGHHLQQFQTARLKPYRNVFSTPFWGEGWALYWELLLWDRGFQNTPRRSAENKIGMLFWRAHRGARIAFSLGFHLGQLTAEQCVDMLVNQVGHEPDNASAEVRRSFAGDYPPLYQCAYLIGGLQFYALQKELVASGRMSYRQFHDAVLRESRIPVELVRAILTRQKLARDFRTSWKFLGEI
jgi:uncharacterized protein (DUF885 family)